MNTRTWLSALLGEHFVNDFAVDVGEPSVGAVVAERELFVIDAEQVQDRGVKIVGRRDLFFGFPRPFVALANGHATFHASAGHPTDERSAIVIPAIAAL